MFWDTHMHCHFSGDSESSPESMIQEAITRGLPGICFTDHLDYDYKEEPGLFDLDFESYHARIHARVCGLAAILFSILFLLE